MTITQSLAAETALLLEKLGHKMYIFVSPNVTECPPDYMDSISAKMFLLMAQTIRSKTAPPNVKKMLTGFDTITPLLQTIQQGQRQGKIKAGDPVALAIAYWGAVQGVAESYAVWPSQPLPQSSWIVDILRA